MSGVLLEHVREHHMTMAIDAIVSYRRFKSEGNTPLYLITYRAAVFHVGAITAITEVLDDDMDVMPASLIKRFNALMFTD